MMKLRVGQIWEMLGTILFKILCCACVLFKNLVIKTYKSIIFPLVLHGCKLGLDSHSKRT